LAGQLINIGELGAPLNGAEWTASSQWGLAQKMQSAFSQEIVKEMNDLGPEAVPPHQSHARIQTVVSAGGSSLDAIDLGRQKTSAGVSIGQVKTGNALSRGIGSMQRSLKRPRAPPCDGSIMTTPVEKPDEANFLHSYAEKTHTTQYRR